ncbi:spore germination protein [Viridibacillus arvi]|uniref:spore germination protein n=1 Tax=Viridibacillus arvi TaxID=263475 RepID=UPI0034CD4381
MEVLLKELKENLGNNNDFFIFEEQILNSPVVLLGLRSLIDLPKTLTRIKKNMETVNQCDIPFANLLDWFGEVKESNTKEALSAVLEGKLLLLLHNGKNNKYVIVEPVLQSLNRSIASPTNENVIQGPLNSFIEDIDTNIGIIRKQIISEGLQVRSFTLGVKQKKKLSLLFFEGIVNLDLLNKVLAQIEKNKDLELMNVQDLTKLMGFSNWLAVPQFKTTEIPEEASNSLLKGKVVIFLDRMPIAFILPGLLSDMFALENDRNFPIPFTISFRSLRVIGLLITMLLPGLYVALVAVNPEVLRIELALALAQSRNGVPYPAIVEILIMLLILELIIEASIRLPKSIGPTITMVGGIILSQAVVDAQLVSNLLIIVLAATTIANSTIAGFQNSIAIRIIKYLIVILASIFGIIGIVAGIVLVSAYLSGITTFGVPYTYLNLKKEDVKNG